MKWFCTTLTSIIIGILFTQFRKVTEYSSYTSMINPQSVRASRDKIVVMSAMYLYNTKYFAKSTPYYLCLNNKIEGNLFLNIENIFQHLIKRITEQKRKMRRLRLQKNLLDSYMIIYVLMNTFSWNKKNCLKTKNRLHSCDICDFGKRKQFSKRLEKCDFYVYL